MGIEPVPSHPADDTAPAPPRHRRRGKEAALLGGGLLLAYLAVAYVLLPAGWSRYAHRHPSLEDMPGITYTGSGIPGDPLNVALIGTREQFLQIMRAAKWDRADALSLRSDLRIAGATVFKRAYDAAPVSSLYLFGRKEDLAFEQPIGRDPRKRNHVRFWRSDHFDPDGRPVWMGSATEDIRVGFSHRTGQITHHIAADVDAERDHLFKDLQQTGDLAETYTVDDFHKICEGRNGGGDRWLTDGKLYVGVIAAKLTP